MEQEHENNGCVPHLSYFNQNSQGLQQYQQQLLSNQYQCNGFTQQQDQSSFNQCQPQISYNNNCNSNGFNNIFGQGYQQQQQYLQESYQQSYQNNNIFGSQSIPSQPNLGFLQNNNLNFSQVASSLFPTSHISTTAASQFINPFNSLQQGNTQQSNLTANSSCTNNTHQQIIPTECNDPDEEDDGEFNPLEDNTNAESSSDSSDTDCDGESSQNSTHQDDDNFNLEAYLRVRDQL